MTTHRRPLMPLFSHFLIAGACALLIAASGVTVASAADAERAGALTDAANAFLATLDDEQRKAVQFTFDDGEQRVRWSNLPIDMLRRAGLRMGDLSTAQREAALGLLRITLSSKGYEKIVGIVRGDEVLRRQGSRMSFGEDEFFLSFMGRPSTTVPWMIQFGGHHLGLNITLAGEHGVLTPSLIAVQPARFEWDGRTVEPMGRETTLALDLVLSLDEGQRDRAVLGHQMRDLALGPGQDGETLQPERIPVSALTDAQKDRLLELVAEWSGILYAAAAARKLDEIRSHLDETWFAWAGPIGRGQGYFRVQGPTVIIEYAPQRLGGDVTQHIHSIFRDPTNDYGASFTRP